MATEPTAICSVYTAFAVAAAHWPERPFVNVLPETAEAYGIPSGETSYAVAMAEVERLRAMYAAAGYAPGERVMLLLENRPAFFLHWFALNALGLSVVPVNPDLRAAELEYLAGHAEPVLAIVIDQRVGDLQRAATAAGRSYPVITPQMTPPVIRPARQDHAGNPHLSSTPAAMLYTSGTTGKPKGCVLSNRYFLKMGEWYETMGGVCTLSTGGERMITPLPLFHMNAMAASLMAMVTVGGCLTVLDRFHPRSWWDSVRAAKATCLHYLGVMPSILMKAPLSPRDREHDVRFGFGAGIDASLHIPFEKRFGIPLVEGWAMTETGAGAVIQANLEPRRRGESCLGRPRPENEIRIITNDGRDAGADEPGELLVRQAGPNPRDGFFTEYFKDPAATKEAWADGWFHTGDIVRQDADGYIFFVDRKKNVIRRSGENIAAVEVESLLLQHPDIKAAAVTAVPDEVRGDEVFACLIVEGKRSAQRARGIVAWSLERMAYYKVPGYVAFVDSLPLTGTQKVQRGELKTLADRLMADSATIDTRAMKKRQGAT